MKRFLLAAILLMTSGWVYAMGEVWSSSHTATADTAVYPLCLQPNKTRRGILHGVCVNDTPSAIGTVTIYNSSSTAVQPVAILRSTSTIVSGCQFFDVYMSSGISYTSTNVNDVTIMYSCY